MVNYYYELGNLLVVYLGGGMDVDIRFGFLVALNLTFTEGA